MTTYCGMLPMKMTLSSPYFWRRGMHSWVIHLYSPSCSIRTIFLLEHGMSTWRAESLCSLFTTQPLGGSSSDRKRDECSRSVCVISFAIMSSLLIRLNLYPYSKSSGTQGQQSTQVKMYLTSSMYWSGLYFSSHSYSGRLFRSKRLSENAKLKIYSLTPSPQQSPQRLRHNHS